MDKLHCIHTVTFRTLTRSEISTNVHQCVSTPMTEASITRLVEVSVEWWLQGQEWKSRSRG